jgi:diadenosine tetraphosphate (Ap4A) HIT family hydrolase
MNMETDCLFCRLKSEWVFENDSFYSVFDAHPVSPGHVLVIPKAHVVSVFDLDPEQWNALNGALKETVRIIDDSDFKAVYGRMALERYTEKSVLFCEKMLSHVGIGKKPEGFNIGINEGRASGRTIDHLHIQIIPRYTGDVAHPVGGIRTILPGLGDYT